MRRVNPSHARALGHLGCLLLLTVGQALWAQVPPAADPKEERAPETTDIRTSPEEAVESSDVVVPPVPLEAEPPAAMSEAELALEEALLFAGTDDEEAIDRLQIFGFADFGYTHAFIRRDSTHHLVTSQGSFAIGNLNLYIASEIAPHTRSLAEIRFMYLPHGRMSVDASEGDLRIDRQRNTSPDPSDYGKAVSWGGISLERVWVEHEFHRYFTVRAGHWLTPYGIWNVDHGSPSVIGIRRPSIIGELLFPESQSGLQAKGGERLGAFDLRYTLTLSNGRGPFVQFRDFDRNKAIGGRLDFGLHLLGDLEIGIAGYGGRYTDKRESLEVTEDGKALLRATVAQQFDELSVAGHLRWRYLGVVLQGEVIGHRRRYTKRGRPIAMNSTRGIEIPEELSAAYGEGLQPDYTKWGGYLILAYEVGLGISPFIEGMYTVNNAATATGGRILRGGVVGIYARVFPTLTLKAQCSYAVFPELDKRSFHDRVSRSVDTQVAWAF